MNKVILMGRLTRDPEIRYSQGAQPVCIARYSLVVNRRFKREGEAEADFINCISFGKAAEFAEKYYRKGLKIVISGRIQTGSYTDRDGKKIYTTDIVVEEQSFAESKGSQGSAEGATGGTGGQHQSYYQQDADGFMHIPDGVEDEGLPFN